MDKGHGSVHAGETKVSNPETLREALRWYAGEIDSLPCEDVEHADDGNAWNSNKDVPSIPNIIFDQGKRAKAALAASGTEAAHLPEYYDDVLKGAPDPGGESYYRQPAQAAASPEGEGRETPEEYKFNCEWKLVPSNRPVDGIDPDDVTKEFVYELPGETRVNGNVGAWYQSAVYWKHRALRQSAAPSGGAALTLEQVIAVLQRVDSESVMGDEEQVGEQFIYRNVGPILLTKFLNELFAQESKTGAAPSPSPLRKPYEQLTPAVERELDRQHKIAKRLP